MSYIGEESNELFRYSHDIAREGGRELIEKNVGRTNHRNDQILLLYLVKLSSPHLTVLELSCGHSPVKYARYFVNNMLFQFGGITR